MKKYIAVKENPKHVNYLKIETYYSLGGTNVFTGRIETRGYCLSVVPVERNGNCESFTAFTGIKQVIKPVKRKSQKAEAEAEKIAENYIPGLIDYVCKNNNLELEKEAA